VPQELFPCFRPNVELAVSTFHRLSHTFQGSFCGLSPLQEGGVRWEPCLSSIQCLLSHPLALEGVWSVHVLYVRHPIGSHPVDLDLNSEHHQHQSEASLSQTLYLEHQDGLASANTFWPGQDVPRSASAWAIPSSLRLRKSSKTDKHRRGIYFCHKYLHCCGTSVQRLLCQICV
jgi:hypothetical protein